MKPGVLKFVITLQLLGIVDSGNQTIEVDVLGNILSKNQEPLEMLKR